jgi:hypothetical protein
MKAEEAQISERRRAALGEGTDVVDLKAMARAAASPGPWIDPGAAGLIATVDLPHERAWQVGPASVRRRIRFLRRRRASSKHTGTLSGASHFGAIPLAAPTAALASQNSKDRSRSAERPGATPAASKCRASRHCRRWNAEATNPVRRPHSEATKPARRPHLTETPHKSTAGKASRPRPSCRPSCSSGCRRRR